MVPIERTAFHIVENLPSLRITEIHYNPFFTLDDRTESNFDNDEFKFVELTNVGSTPLDTAGLTLVETNVERDP